MPPTALTEFKGVHASTRTWPTRAVIPNDETGAPIISYLIARASSRTRSRPRARTPRLIGLQTSLAGYQCGTVYKPIYLEAQAAVALAMYLRAGKAAPNEPAERTTADPRTTRPVPSALLTPDLGHAGEHERTVIKDKFVPDGPAVRRQVRGAPARPQGSLASLDAG